MIRYKDKIFEQWSICPATGDIFDAETGEIQPVKIFRGRPVFKNMAVHRIMAYTFYGYKPGYDVHHKDENKMNNALSNLVYLTHSEHARLHSGELLHEETRLKKSKSLKGRTFSELHKKKIGEASRGRHVSEEQKAKQSAAMKGKPSPYKGKHHSEEARAKIGLKSKGRVSRTFWWNNGEIRVRSKVCPGEGWIKGKNLMKVRLEEDIA